jgi:hypothetical protein
MILGIDAIAEVFALKYLNFQINRKKFLSGSGRMVVHKPFPVKYKS